MKPAAFAFFISLIYAVPALGLTLENFRRGLESPALKGITEDYLTGVGQGFWYANERLEMKGQSLLYCQPNGLTLNSGNYFDLIDNVARQYDFESNQQVEVILLIGLEKEFPCP